MVTTFYPPFNFGGDGIYVQRLAHALARKGHKVDVIHDADAFRALSGTDPSTAESDKHEASKGVTVHRLASRWPTLASLTVQQLGRPTVHAAQLRDLLTDRFDVIHFHNVSLIGGPGLWPLGTGIKLHTAHEHWLVCPTHILWRDNREVCDAKRCLTCVLRHKRPPQLWRATNLIAHHAPHVDAFLLLSRSAMENHKRFGFTAPMTLFPSFLPSEEDMVPSERNTQTPYFLFAGRLEIIKGLQDVIPVFARHQGAELWIAGSGGYEAELRKLARGYGNIRFLGRIPMHELRPLYRDARAVITPSKCLEVFPLTVLEAFRDATPIIARALGPYPEIIEQTNGGLLFETPDELAHALRQFTDNPEYAKTMGRDGQNAFQRQWSEDVVLKKYFEVIRQVALRRGMDDLAERATM